MKLLSRVRRDGGQDAKLNSRREPRQSRSLMPGHAPVNAAGSCAARTGHPIKLLRGVHASAEVWSFTARRRLRQAARSPLLPPCTSDTTRTSRLSGRLSRGDAITSSSSSSLGGDALIIPMLLLLRRYYCTTTDFCLRVSKSCSVGVRWLLPEGCYSLWRALLQPLFSLGFWVGGSWPVAMAMAPAPCPCPARYSLSPPTQRQAHHWPTKLPAPISHASSCWHLTHHLIVLLS